MADTVYSIRKALEEGGVWRGILARPGDATVLREIYLDNEYHSFHIERGDRVLDLGAHIGALTRWCLEHGASHVTSVEPHPETAQYLRKNTVGYQVHVWEGAVVRWVRPLMLCMTKQHASASILSPHSRAVQRFEVQPILLNRLFENQDYDAMKIDIEGAEYEVLLPYPAELQDSSITRIYAEIHRKTKEMHDKGVELMEEMERFGWKTVWTRSWITEFTHQWPSQVVWER